MGLCRRRGTNIAEYASAAAKKSKGSQEGTTKVSVGGIVLIHNFHVFVRRYEAPVCIFVFAKGVEVELFKPGNERMFAS